MGFYFKKSKNPLDDSDLLRLYKAEGDKKYVAELFKRYSHLVLGICMNYLKDKDEAKDATIQIFEKMFSELYEKEVQTFKNWIVFVSRNHCISMLRKLEIEKKRREDYIRSESGAASGVDLEDALKKEREYDHLYKSMNMLNDEQKKCLQLFYLNNMSYTEIADKTGYTLKQVKSFLQNGKRNLKLLFHELPNN